jgi:hypothetical protein
MDGDWRLATGDWRLAEMRKRRRGDPGGADSPEKELAGDPAVLLRFAQLIETRRRAMYRDHDAEASF